MDEEDCHAHWHHTPLGTIYGGVAPKFLSSKPCALDTSATILPFFFSIHIPQHSSHNLHTLSLTLTHLTSHTLTPTLTPSLATIFHTLTLTLTPSLATIFTPSHPHSLTSLATIHQRISWSPWQLLPVQSWAHHLVRPDMMKCSHTERQLQRRRIDIMKYAAPEIYNPHWGNMQPSENVQMPPHLCYSLKIFSPPRNAQPLEKFGWVSSVSPPTFLPSHDLFILLGLLREVFLVHWHQKRGRCPPNHTTSIHHPPACSKEEGER